MQEGAVEEFGGQLQNLKDELGAVASFLRAAECGVFDSGERGRRVRSVMMAALHGRDASERRVRRAMANVLGDLWR
eukprot:9879890-Lingulodinium_polyedra.AAC.1